MSSRITTSASPVLTASAATDGHRTVERVVAILEHAAATPEGVRLTAVAALLGAPKSSVHALMRGLVAAGYLVEQNGRYLIGPGVTALLAPFNRRSLAEIAHKELERLSSESGETVMLGTRVGDNIVYIDQVQSRERIRYAAHLQERRPLLHTSMGKVFLAHLDRRARERLLRRAAEHEIADTARLQEELEVVARESVAYNREETVAGVTAVASGIRDGGGAIMAALSIAGPSYRMDDALETHADEVRAAAGRVERLLAGKHHRA